MASGALPTPPTTPAGLHQVCRDSYRLPDALHHPITLILELSLPLITFLERQQKRLDAAIAKRMASIPHTLDTISGFGPVTSGGITEIAGLPRFHFDQAKVAPGAGLKWRPHQVE